MFNLLGRRFKQLAVLAYLIMINNIKGRSQAQVPLKHATKEILLGQNHNAN